MEKDTEVKPEPSPKLNGITTSSASSSRFSQCYHKIHWFVAVMCVFGFVEGASINGFVSSSLSTIERRFQFQSSESGLIVSSADIGATCLVLFVSYYGAKSHKPRVIGTGCLVMAVGCFLFFLPHLLVGRYEYSTGGNTAGHVCDVNRTEPCLATDGESLSHFLPIFAIAQAVQGIGFTPAFTVGAAYIDENSTPDRTAFYMGLIYALTAMGVAAGYITGGQFLNIWVDVGRTDSSSITIDVADRRWVGAWWLGFVISAVFYVLLLFPLCSFPEKMPRIHQDSNMLTDVAKETENEKDVSFLKKLLAFPRAIFKLVKKPTFVFVVLVGSLETLVIQGFASFSVKILEDKFDLEAADGSLIVGVVTVIGGAGGMLGGGVLIRKFNLQLDGILRLCMGMFLLALAFGGGFFLNCPESKFAGLTSEFGANGTCSGLGAPCNRDCNCLLEEFDPVCGDDGITYFSPCHAGCDDTFVQDGVIRTYSNCSCVSASSVISSLMTAVNKTSLTSAVSGSCVKDCPIVWLFIFLLFGALSGTFLTVTPLSIAILRCVPDDKRSLGLGVQWVALRLLGTIPGPILTGTVLDNTCSIWQQTCDGQGNCWIYDRYTMGGYLFAWWASVKIVCFSILATVLWLNRSKFEAKLEFNPAVSVISAN